MSKLKIGLIGLGYWGRNLARNLNSIPDIDFCFIADPIDNLEFSKYSHIKGHYKCYKEALSKHKPDGVLVATPISTHSEIALECLRADAHVLVQKPLCDSIDDINRMRDFDKVVMTAHTFLFNEAVKEINSSRTRAKVGEFLHINSTRTNLGLFTNKHNVVWDLAPHDFSIITHLLQGEFPLWLSASGFAHTDSGVVDTANISLKYKSKSALINLSWFSPIKQRVLTISGQNKMVVYDDTKTDDKVKLIDKSVNYNDSVFDYRTGDTFSPLISSTEAIMNEIQHFIKCIKKEEKCISDLDFSEKVVKLILATNTSIKNKGEPIELT